MSLPFEQLNFVFHHIYYSVPATVSKNVFSKNHLMQWFVTKKLVGIVLSI